MNYKGGTQLEDRDWLILSILYKEKNITKAARVLFISQPALTTRLQHIEKFFGVKIVHRSKKGVHFTSEGEFLAKTATKMLLQTRKIREQVANFSTKVTGTLIIGASGYFTMYTLPPLLQKFKQQYPDVEFKVTTTWSKDIFSLAYNQDVHVGFVSSDYGGCTEKYLLYEEPICIASINEINIDKLPSLPRIDYKSDTLIKTQIDNWWRENFRQPPLISMQVDKLATCKEMVKAGLGYAILPPRILRDIDKIHTFNLRDANGNNLLRKTWMIYYPGALDMHVVKVFINFVKNYTF